jgi:hypothetical protein
MDDLSKAGLEKKLPQVSGELTPESGRGVGNEEEARSGAVVSGGTGRSAAPATPDTRETKKVSDAKVAATEVAAKEDRYEPSGPSCMWVLH